MRVGYPENLALLPKGEQMAHYWNESSSEAYQFVIANDLAVRLITQLMQIEEATNRPPDTEDVANAWKQVEAEAKAVGLGYPAEAFAFQGLATVTSVVERLGHYPEAVSDHLAQAYEL